jgi:SsrA-binding protein
VARKSKKPDDSLLAQNRRASHNYLLLRKIEAGIVLLGPEVKSARQGRVNLTESYARIQNGEVFLHGAHFSPYSHTAHLQIEPVRPRKLLLHAQEIRKLAKETKDSGMTLVATCLYLKGGRIKVEIAVARGKQQHDKRETLRKQDADREMRRSTGTDRRG